MNNIILSEEERQLLFELLKSGIEREDVEVDDLPEDIKKLYYKLGGQQGDYCYDL
jgi:hypothetical protein